MTRFLSFRAACLSLALGLLPAVANAQTVVLLRPRAADPALLQAFGRLRGELAACDFEVVVAEAGAEVASPRVLARAADDARAVAAVALVRTEGLESADIWISDRATGKTSMRTIATAPSAEAPNLMAIRAVDLLRTSLREYARGEAPPPDVVGAFPERAPERTRAWAAAPRIERRWLVRPAVVMQSTLSNRTATVGPSIAFGAAVFPRMHLRAEFQGPLMGDYGAPSGASVSLRQEQAFVEGGYTVASLWAFDLEVFGGLGLHHLDVQGAASPPYIGHSDSAWAFLAEAGLGLDVRLGEAVSLAAGARAIFLTPRPIVQLAGALLPYGRPYLQGYGGLLVSF